MASSFNAVSNPATDQLERLRRLQQGTMNPGDSGTGTLAGPSTLTTGQRLDRLRVLQQGAVNPGDAGTGTGIPPSAATMAAGNEQRLAALKCKGVVGAQARASEPPMPAMAPSVAAARHAADIDERNHLAEKLQRAGVLSKAELDSITKGAPDKYGRTPSVVASEAQARLVLSQKFDGLPNVDTSDKHGDRDFNAWVKNHPALVDTLEKYRPGSPFYPNPRHAAWENRVGAAENRRDDLDRAMLSVRDDFQRMVDETP